MPVKIDLTGCCTECFMPLHGGICEFDPEHTPIPVELCDPDLAGWYPTWLHNYQARTSWHYSIFGPLPPVVEENVRDLTLGSFRAKEIRDLEASGQRHPGSAIWGQKPVCPECFMPLLGNCCSLDPAHDVTLPVSHDPHTLRRTRGQRLPTLAPARGNVARFGVVVGSVLEDDHPVASPSSLADRDNGLKASPEDLSTWLPTSIAAWLYDLDAIGFLNDYHDTIVGNFDSPAQVLDVYARRREDGQTVVLAEKFLDEMGVQKLGHRRLFEKWFKESAGLGLESGLPLRMDTAGAWERV